jgi:ubiquinone/menaquinone biosynthesis C-methylase UbiE
MHRPQFCRIQIQMRCAVFALLPILSNMADIKGYRDRFRDAAKAEKYASRFDEGPRHRIDRREQRAVEKIFSDLSDCRSVLDVPSGAGRFAAALAGPNRLLIELDAAMEILRSAAQRARRHSVNAIFIQGDASRLPLRNEVVDCVFCNRLLHHILSVEERRLILREFHRVTRRHVVVSFFDYHKFGVLRRTLKTLKGRKPRYEAQPTQEHFSEESTAAGFQVLAVVPTGPLWVTQKYFVLEKQ